MPTARYQLIALATVVAFALTSCWSAATYRYQVPRDGPHQAEAKACAQQCDKNHVDRDEALKCWSRCPGAVVTKNEHCDGPTGPPAPECAKKCDSEYYKDRRFSQSAASRDRILCRNDCPRAHFTPCVERTKTSVEPGGVVVSILAVLAVGFVLFLVTFPDIH